METMEFLQSLRDCIEKGDISYEIRNKWGIKAKSMLQDIELDLSKDNSTELGILGVYVSILEDIEINELTNDEKKFIYLYDDITERIRKMNEEKIRMQHVNDIHSDGLVLRPVKKKMDKNGIALTIGIIGIVLVIGIFVASLAIALK